MGFPDIRAMAPASAPRAKILVLGGSSDGFDVAAGLVAAGFDPVTSFAGRTATRRTPAGRARVGGFGGAAGLGDYLKAEGVALVIDATHPFAARMKTNAGAAGAASGVPVIHVERPEWAPVPGDRWIMVADVEAAAAAAPVTEGPCFVTVGRQELAPFVARRDLDLLIRVIDAPDAPFPHPRATFLADRGPFGLDAERRLFEARRVGSLVTKNSGGEAAAAKLVAARERGVPVVMVARPPRPDGRRVASAADAVAAAVAMLG
jgi:precorrin-6A/cobalt-precorrin-6A reductase